MYLVTGAGGFLGSYVIKHILEDTDDSVYAVSRNGSVYGCESGRVKPVLCDVLTQTEVIRDAVKDEKSLKVIHLCAQHNIDKVAEDPEGAYALNVSALEKILEYLSPVCLFFASSDTVYGEGGERKFSEEDELNPISIYGRQKLAGEKAVLAHGGNVLRLPFMFGESLSAYKKHFYDEVISRLSAGENVRMFTDSVRSTLSFDTVAEVFVKLCETENGKIPRILNVAGDEALSKYDAGVRLAEKHGLDKNLIVPCLSAGTWKKGAERASSTVMNNTKLKKIPGIPSLKFE